MGSSFRAIVSYGEKRGVLLILSCSMMVLCSETRSDLEGPKSKRACDTPKFEVPSIVPWKAIHDVYRRSSEPTSLSSLRQQMTS